MVALDYSQHNLGVRYLHDRKEQGKNKEMSLKINWKSVFIHDGAFVKEKSKDHHTRHKMKMQDYKHPCAWQKRAKTSL